MSGIKLNKLQKSKVKKDNAVGDFFNKEISFGNSKISNKEKEVMYSSLAILLEAGITLKDALDIIENQLPKKKTKELVIDIKEKLIRGISFSQILADKKDFSVYEIYSVKIGEETGMLAYVLNELAIYYKKKVKQKRQIISVLSYPVLVITVSLMAVVFMMYVIVPMFADIFSRFNTKLPAITQVVINASNWSKEKWPIIVIFFLAVILLIALTKNKTWFKKYTSMFLLKIPFFGSLVQSAQLARFTSMMALLVKAQVPLVTSLEMVSEAISFYPLKIAVKKISVDIVQGQPLNVLLSNYSIFSKRFVAMIKVGEEINRLDEFFDKTNKDLSDEIDYKTGVMGNVLEPFLLIFLGLIVGTILIAMYLPMFKLSSSF